MTCRFKSCHPHQKIRSSTKTGLLIFYSIGKQDLKLKKATSVGKRLIIVFSEVGTQTGTASKACGRQAMQIAKQYVVLSSAPRPSKVRFASIFMRKNHSPASLLLLFHKKSRSACLFGCKRPLDDTLSLPTFCEFGFDIL